jgi:predicted transcriptional regulator
MGHHQSLLVTRAGKIVGILRLTDVFGEICDVIRETCQL